MLIFSSRSILSLQMVRYDEAKDNIVKDRESRWGNVKAGILRFADDANVFVVRFNHFVISIIVQSEFERGIDFPFVFPTISSNEYFPKGKEEMSLSAQIIRQ